MTGTVTTVVLALLVVVAFALAVRRATRRGSCSSCAVGPSCPAKGTGCADGATSVASGPVALGIPRPVALSDQSPSAPCCPSAPAPRDPHDLVV